VKYGSKRKSQKNTAAETDISGGNQESTSGNKKMAKP